MVTNQGSAKTVVRALEILKILQELNGARVSEVADRLDIPRSSAHRYLSTLYSEEYLVKEGDIYQIGLQFANIGEFARNRKQEYRMARPKVKELAERTDERAHFIVEEHGYSKYVFIERGKNAVKTDPGIGKWDPLHTGAAGKAILAHLDERRVNKIINERGLQVQTDQSITNKDDLLEELQQIRECGFSINDQEHIQGQRAVGVPISLPHGEPIGALSVSGPTQRMKGEWFRELLPNLLLGTANELELNIAHS
jgi:DNA-binding IclR family transcriptional regulator